MILKQFLPGTPALSCVVLLFLFCACGSVPESAEMPFDTGNYFSDAEVSALCEETAEIIAGEDVQKDFEKKARRKLWECNVMLAEKLLTPEQRQYALGFIVSLEEQYPGHPDLFDRQRFMLNNLMLGDTAPNITGREADGTPIELVEYRGKVTLLIFSGAWCPDCRGEFPFHRFMIEYFAGKPFDIVSVNSDELDAAKSFKEKYGLHYRLFYDGFYDTESPGRKTEGPIHTEWNTAGWPAVFFLDADGVIRCRTAFLEKSITVVRNLLNELERKNLLDRK